MIEVHSDLLNNRIYQENRSGFLIGYLISVSRAPLWGFAIFILKKELLMFQVFIMTITAVLNVPKNIMIVKKHQIVFRYDFIKKGLPYCARKTLRWTIFSM